MSGRKAGGCLSDDKLLRLGSGELGPRAARGAERHLDTCPECRERLDGFAAVFDEYRAHVGADHPSRSGDAAGRLVRLMLAEPAVADRDAGSRVRWGVPAAAVGMVALALMLWSSHGEVTLNAETLIARAVESEGSQPAPANEVVTIALGSAAGGVRPARTAESELVPDGAQPVAERGRMARELARRLAGHAFDWRTPLSARPFQHWRQTSTVPVTDSLEWVDGSLVRVSTSASAGAIRSAELTLLAPTYRPVAQIWRFADGFEVELRSVPNLPPVPALPTTVVRHDAAASPPVRARARSLPEIELEARVALEHLGVPLGRNLSLRRAGGVVSIEGVAAGPRVAAIRAEAGRLEGVVVRLRESGTGPDAGPPLSPGLTAWLLRTFGPGELQERFLERAGQLRTELEDATVALDELGRRYPSGTTASLPAAARDSLDDLAQAYYGRFVSRFEALEMHLAPLTGTLSRRLFEAHAPERWRELPGRLRPALDGLEPALDGVRDPLLASPEQVDERGRTMLRDALTALASATTL